MTIIEVGASASVPVEESGLLVTDIATSVKCQHNINALQSSNNKKLKTTPCDQAFLHTSE